MVEWKESNATKLLMIEWKESDVIMMRFIYMARQLYSTLANVMAVPKAAQKATKMMACLFSVLLVLW